MLWVLARACLSAAKGKGCGRRWIFIFFNKGTQVGVVSSAEARYLCISHSAEDMDPVFTRLTLH